MDATPHKLDTDTLLKGEPPPQRPAGMASATLFVVYNSYRTLVGACLVALLIIPAARDLVSGLDRSLFALGAGFLLLTALPLASTPGRLVRRSDTGVFGLMLADITAIVLIVGASGGILSGFSVLYLITVAAAAVLLSTRILATLVAAIAVIAVLFDAAWMVSRGEAELGMLLPAGVLGSLLFAVSLLVQTMANRLAAAEAEVDATQAKMMALQQLNEQIILHMQTGILLVKPDGATIAINSAAQRLLNLEPNRPSRLGLISPELAHQYQEWCEGGRDKPEPFQLDSDQPAMIAGFAALDDREDTDNLVFIEDYTPVTQFAQSLKLNSLSKLTASIAHEIRNPLAAISHAAQLLSESTTIDAADAILCDILVGNSQRVSQIIDNVTEVSRRQAPKPRNIQLDRWLAEFIEEYRALRTQPCVIAVNADCGNRQVSIDPEHLKRILSNLLDNGLRHSEEDSGEAKLRLDTHIESASGQLHLDVVDFGLGVAESNIHRLFEPFFTTSAKGSGLGLYLCKELCEINGARLNYLRTATGESAFRVSLKQEEVS